VLKEDVGGVAGLEGDLVDVLYGGAFAGVDDGAAEEVFRGSVLEGRRMRHGLES
jgi:hypothetical protein